jgi:hypothetical protein
MMAPKRKLAAASGMDGAGALPERARIAAAKEGLDFGDD